MIHLPSSSVFLDPQANTAEIPYLYKDPIAK